MCKFNASCAALLVPFTQTSCDFFAVSLRDLGNEEGFGCQFCNCIYTCHTEFIDRIPIIDNYATDLETLR